jgi:ankyrin repeat protein
MVQKRLEKGKAPHINPVPRLPEALAEERPRLTGEIRGQLNIELTQAAAQGRIADVKRLIGAGAGVNVFIDNGTPLMWAARNGSTAICGLLISKGANIDALDTVNGWTALRLAAKNGHTETCAFLLDCGANFEVKDEPSWVNGWTPLMYAAGYGHTETCALLIERYAEAGGDASCFVNETSAKVNGCSTALHLATLDGHTKTCALLVAKGANVNAKDFAGRTALKCAEQGNKYKTVAFLKSMESMQERMGGASYNLFISAFEECVAA